MKMEKIVGVMDGNGISIVYAGFHTQTHANQHRCNLLHIGFHLFSSRVVFSSYWENKHCCSCMGIFSSFFNYLGKEDKEKEWGF